MRDEQMIFIPVILLAIAAGSIFYAFFASKQRIVAISSYGDCVAAGYPIMESYPSQCRTPDGRTFVNPREQAPQMPGQDVPYATSSASNEGCIVGGCSKELCTDAADEPMMSPCIYRAEYACYKTAACERQTDGKCGWTESSELMKCIRDSREPASFPEPN